MQHQREDLLLQIPVAVPPVLTAVHENIELPGVSVEVAVHSDGAFFHQLLDHHLGLMDGRKGFLDDILVLPVEISPGQITPSVPDDDAVRVQHRDNLEDESLPQSCGCLRVSCEELDDSSHHPGAGGLSRVNSGAEDDADLALDLLQAVRGGDGEQVDVVPGQGATEEALGAELSSVRAALNTEEVLGEVGVPVGIAVRQVAGNKG